MRAAIVVITAVLVIGIGWITLGPQPIGRDGWLAFTLVLFRGEDGFNGFAFYAAEFTANLILFVPVGLILVRLVRPRRWWLALAFALVITVGIEVGQGALPGRISDPRDILANVIGALIGVSAAVLWNRRRTARDRRVRATDHRAAAPAG